MFGENSRETMFENVENTILMGFQAHMSENEAIFHEKLHNQAPEHISIYFYCSAVLKPTRVVLNSFGLRYVISSISDIKSSNLTTRYILNIQRLIN